MTPEAGEPSPLGATASPEGTNFALLSVTGTAVDLCLFDRVGGPETARLRLPDRTGPVFHGFVPGIRPGQLYGFRVYGPWRPAEGHRFNPAKLVIDPHARLLAGAIRWDDAVYAHTRGHPDGDGVLDGRDSAPFMPLSVVVDPAFDWGDDRAPRRGWDETLVYEAHVKGLTHLHPEIPPELRGTYEALGHPAIVSHLTRLGVTALELLPIHAFADDRFLVERGLVNYWGYSPLGYFAPDARYLGPNGLSGLKAAVKALHTAGIEVILDVVYNHSAEQEEYGPTLSFRGVDNALYYKAMPDDPGRTLNCTGCGNALDLAKPDVCDMVLASLRFWVEEYRIDGFRFDLAATLARDPYDFDPAAPFLRGVASDPVLSRVKMIAEPWDLGMSGYRLGQFPVGWAEWSDASRDAIRRFWRGDGVGASGLARVLSGSRELFEASGRGPLACVNYVTAHDGFTLADVVSYEERHNGPNGEENRDGHTPNYTCNEGVEGPSSDPAVDAARARQIRNMLATLMLAQGVPMILGGDELGRTQGGNNNAYCQDNETTWLDWRAVGTEGDGTEFIGTFLALRRAHPALRRGTFFTGDRDPATGLRDVHWLAPDGREMATRDWEDHGGARCFGMEFGGVDGHDRLLAIFNADHPDVAFRLPPDLGSRARRELLRTGPPVPAGTRGEDAGTIIVTGRSVVLLAAD